MCACVGARAGMSACVCIFTIISISVWNDWNTIKNDDHCISTCIRRSSIHARTQPIFSLCFLLTQRLYIFGIGSLFALLLWSVRCANCRRHFSAIQSNRNVWNMNCCSSTNWNELWNFHLSIYKYMNMNMNILHVYHGAPHSDLFSFDTHESQRVEWCKRLLIPCIWVRVSLFMINNIFFRRFGRFFRAYCSD